MLLSMTGYGRAEGRFANSRMVVEIRSVNHRFCEISVRVPRVLAPFEGRVRERVAERISRGKINLNVSVDGGESALGCLRVNEDLTRTYVETLRDLKTRFQLGGEVELSTVIAMPDVVSWEPDAIDEAKAWSEMSAVLEVAIDDIVAMKRSEAKNLEVDALERLEIIERSLEAVEVRVPEMITAARKRWSDRLAEISQDLEYNRNRLEAELVLFVDRSDCTEECVRLRSHVGQFREMIASPAPAGRRLNFLLQEMNREANTIGSKTQDVPIALDVIRIKEEVERLREQIQNFE